MILSANDLPVYFRSPMTTYCLRLGARFPHTGSGTAPNISSLLCAHRPTLELLGPGAVQIRLKLHGIVDSLRPTQPRSAAPAAFSISKLLCGAGRAVTPATAHKHVSVFDIPSPVLPTSRRVGQVGSNPYTQSHGQIHKLTNSLRP